MSRKVLALRPGLSDGVARGSVFGCVKGSEEVVAGSLDAPSTPRCIGDVPG